MRPARADYGVVTLRRAAQIALVLSVAAAVVGCGAAKKKTVVYHDGQALRSGPITVTGTTTVPNVPTGTLIHCKDGAGAKVPRRGWAVAALTPVQSYPAPTAPSGEIQLRHLQNGSVKVLCKPSK